MHGKTMLEEAKSLELQRGKNRTIIVPSPSSQRASPRKKNRKKEIAPKTYPISVIRDSVADQRVISRCLFELPRDFVSFRFPDGGEAAAPLSQEDARLLRDIPGRNCRSLIPRCLIPFDYHPIAALPILYVDESHCLPLFPIATFPPYPRQSNRRITETKGGTSSSSSTTPPTIRVSRERISIPSSRECINQRSQPLDTCCMYGQTRPIPR